MFGLGAMFSCLPDEFSFLFMQWLFMILNLLSSALYFCERCSSDAKPQHLSLHHESWKPLKPCSCIYIFSLLYEFVSFFFLHGNVCCMFLFFMLLPARFHFYTVFSPKAKGCHVTSSSALKWESLYNVTPVCLLCLLGPVCRNPPPPPLTVL